MRVGDLLEARLGFLISTALTLYRGGWTLARVAALVSRQFGAEVTPRMVRRWVLDHAPGLARARAVRAAVGRRPPPRPNFPRLPVQGRP